MITRHHLALVLMGTLIIGIAVFPADIPVLGALAAGSCIGAVLPDIQIAWRARNGLHKYAWYVSRFSVHLCIPVLCATYYLLGLNLCPSDKRLTHSVTGIIAVGAIFAAFLSVPVLLFPRPLVHLVLAAFVSGVIAGLILHLVEDACTFRGIAPFFPFSTMRVSGSIRPCDGTDRRIARYHVHHCSVAVVVAGFHLIAPFPGPLSLAFSIVALFSCLAIMVWLSDVHIRTGDIFLSGPGRESPSPS